jgi:hypothetical protein
MPLFYGVKLAYLQLVQPTVPHLAQAVCDLQQDLPSPQHLVVVQELKANIMATAEAARINFFIRL